MRKSSRGNPYHDERGRFCSGPKSGKPYTVSERTSEEYAIRTENRIQQVNSSIKEAPKPKGDTEKATKSEPPKAINGFEDISTLKKVHSEDGKWSGAFKGITHMDKYEDSENGIFVEVYSGSGKRNIYIVRTSERFLLHYLEYDYKKPYTRNFREALKYYNAKRKDSETMRKIGVENVNTVGHILYDRWAACDSDGYFGYRVEHRVNGYHALENAKPQISFGKDNSIIVKNFTTKSYYGNAPTTKMLLDDDSGVDLSLGIRDIKRKYNNASVKLLDCEDLNYCDDENGQNAFYNVSFKIKL